MGDEVAVQNIATNIYGDVCLRKQRRRRQKKLLTELFFDYSNNTTLHGIPYITKRGLTIIEKIFWILTTVSSIIWCSVLIYQLWARWKASPVIVTISEHMVPVSMVPFPSITICPQSKSYVSKYNYSYESSKKWPKHDSENYSISDYQRFYKLEDVKQICGNIFESINIFRNFTNSSLLDHILEVSPDIDDVLLECKWRDNTTNCGDIFSKVLTGEGVCFTTNSLSYEEIFTKEVANAARHLEATNRSNGWSLDRGYFSSKLDHYPRRGIENPVKPDLEVILQENTTETDSSCNSHNSGFRVYVHHPASLPQSSLYYYAVINNQRSSVALSFNILNTSEALRSYDAIKRQCYFTHEKILRYFKDYTEKNCWIECLSNYTYFKCQCVSFYLPLDGSSSLDVDFLLKKEGFALISTLDNNSNEICAEGKLDCVTGAQEELVMKEMYSPTCNCLPACVSVDYDAEILKTDFNIRKQFDYVHRLLNFEFIESTGINYSQLQVFYKKPRFLTMRRSELFGIAEFIANCGGLLGLFMGFSFLSLMELVFYFTLRMTCILKKDLEEEKTQAKARLE